MIFNLSNTSARLLAVAAAAALAACASDRQSTVEPSPNDPAHWGSGTSGTPASIGVTGPGSGLGTGSNGPADTSGATAPGAQAPSVAVTAEDANFRPANAGSNSRLKSSSEESGQLPSSGPVTGGDGAIGQNSDAGTAR